MIEFIEYLRTLDDNTLITIILIGYLLFAGLKLLILAIRGIDDCD